MDRGDLLVVASSKRALIAVRQTRCNNLPVVFAVHLFAPARMACNLRVIMIILMHPLLTHTRVHIRVPQTARSRKFIEIH